MTDRYSLTSSRQEHLDAHNFIRRGPFLLQWNTAGIDTGVVLFTPAMGESVMGLYVEFGEVFDVPSEQIGLCLPGTTDGDMRMKFSVTSMTAVKPTFPAADLPGIPYGLAGFRVPSAAPIRARTVIGGNTTGSLSLYVMTLPA